MRSYAASAFQLQPLLREVCLSNDFRKFPLSHNAINMKERSKMMIKPNRNLLWSALVAACLTKSIGAAADTVWVSKDCTGGPCTVQGGPYPTLGFFRLTGSSFGWSATYTGTPQRFWVSQGGANMADTQLSTSNGDLGGTANLPLGIVFKTPASAGSRRKVRNAG